MSQKLKASLEQILAMPYFKNEAARSGTVKHGHEHALALVLSSNGFQHITGIKTSKYLGKKYDDQDWVASNYPDLTPGSFAVQPAGANNFPDFLIRDTCGRFLLMEAKSGNGTGISWNDNLPKPNVIYVFSSGSTDETTAFLGQDVIDDAQRSLITDLRRDLDVLVKRANNRLVAIDVFNRGWNFYPRPKFQQLQGRQARKSMLKIERVNYFKHPDRDECELRALEFAGA